MAAEMCKIIATICYFYEDLGEMVGLDIGDFLRNAAGPVGSHVMESRREQGKVLRGIEEKDD